MQSRVSAPLLVLMLAALWLLSGAAIAQEATPTEDATAAEEEAAEAIQGTVRTGEGEPVEGVVIQVFDADGAELGTAQTDAEGAWSFPLPGPGNYSATLDEGSLPEGTQLRNPDRATLEFEVRPGQQRTLLYPLGEGGGGGTGMLGQAINLTVSGIKLGVIIAMLAIGLSLVYGTTGLVNFAHGELVTFGAVAAWYWNNTGWAVGLTAFGAQIIPEMQLVPRIHIVPAALLAVIMGGLLGAALDRGLFRPLRARGTGLIALLVISIGLALLLRHIILLPYEGRTRPYLDYTIQERLVFGPVSITPRDLVVTVLSFAVLIAVGLVLQRTKIGKAMRAVSDNRDLAESSGIDVDRVILFVWVFGSALAALGGVFLGLTEGGVNYNMGFNFLLLIFAGVILGGLGTAYGAMVGSLVVGLVTQLSTLWFSTELKFVWALGVLVVVLLVRPQGILGRAERIG